MHKSLGTNLHLWHGAFSHARNKQSRANYLHLFSPFPTHLPAMLETCARYFSRVSTLYWGVGGGGATYFATDNSAFLKLLFKITDN